MEKKITGSAARDVHFFPFARWSVKHGARGGSGPPSAGDESMRAWRRLRCLHTHTHTHAFARTPLMRPLINFHRLNGGKSNYAPHVSTVGQLARRLPAAYGAESRSGGASGRFCWSPTGLTGPEGSRQLLTGHLGRGGRKCGRSGCSHILFLLRRRRIL